jgi:glutamate dehydrogenase
MDDFTSTNSEQRARDDLIDQSANLSEKSGKLPKGFVSALFSRASHEDLTAYRPDDLATIAQSSFAFFEIRPTAGAKIRLWNPPGAEGEQLHRITVVEIVNDDMPFLLDSVMGEIGARNLTVQLVAHPIFSVARDSDGKLAKWKLAGDGDGRTGRESFIHIHIERIEESRFDDISAALASLLQELRVCVADWQKMLDRVQDAIKDLQANAKHLSKEEIFEAADFAQWLVDEGITSISLNPDSVIATWQQLAGR